MTLVASHQSLTGAGFLGLREGSGWNGGEPREVEGITGCAEYLGRLRRGTAAVFRRVADGAYRLCRIKRGYEEIILPEAEAESQDADAIVSELVNPYRWIGITRERADLFKLARRPLLAGASNLEKNLFERIKGYEGEKRMRLELEYDAAQTARTLENPDEYILGSTERFGAHPTAN